MGEMRAAGVLCHLLLSFLLLIIIVVICYCHYYYCFGFCAYHVACDDQPLKPHQLFKGLSVVLTKADMQTNGRQHKYDFKVESVLDAMARVEPIATLANS